MTSPVKRGRPRKAKPAATWQVGSFQAEFDGEYYTLRHGPGLIIRTKSEAEFKATEELIKGA